VNGSLSNGGKSEEVLDGASHGGAGSLSSMPLTADMLSAAAGAAMAHGDQFTLRSRQHLNAMHATDHISADTGGKPTGHHPSPSVPASMAGMVTDLVASAVRSAMHRAQAQHAAALRAAEHQWARRAQALAEAAAEVARRAA